MGRRASDLHDHTVYQRLVALDRAIDMLLARATRQEGASEVRVEVTGLEPFDDFLVFYRSESSRESRHGWQVKEQASDVAKDEAEVLFSNIPLLGLDVYHFAVPSAVNVSGVSNLSHLQKLGRKAARLGADLDAILREANTSERAWLAFVRSAFQAPSDREAVAWLKRLEVHFYGSREEIDRRSLLSLGHLYGEHADRAYALLRDFFVSEVRSSTVVTCDLLNRVLADLAVARVEVLAPRRRADLRRAYLEHLAAGEQSRPALGEGESPSGIPLSSVYVEPELTHVVGGQLAAAKMIRRSARDAALLRAGRPTELARREAVEERDREPDSRHERTLEEWIEASPGARRLFVVGDVGTGKTTVLRHAVHRQGEKAKNGLEDALPVLIRARDLVDGIDAAVKRSLRSAGEDTFNLWQVESARWRLFIDGMDEIANGWPLLDEAVRTGGDRVVAVVAAGRATAWPTSDANTIVLQLRPWSSRQTDGFFAAWAQHDATAVRRVRELRETEPSTVELFENPLTATLALMVARSPRELPTSRAALYRAVIEELTQGRPLQRNPEPKEAYWPAAAAAVERIALQHVQEGNPCIKLETLRSALRQSHPNSSRVIERFVSREIGLFVETGDGEIDFPFRGLAEFLAGRELGRRGADAIVDAARDAWGEEVVRHAIGDMAACDDSATACSLLERLCQDAGRGAAVGFSLRPLLVATRTAADIGNAAQPIAAPLAQLVFGTLVDEGSIWTGDYLAEVVRGLARAHGPVWNALVRPATARLADPRTTPSVWFDAHLASGATACLSALIHRDPSVRKVALQKLAPNLGEPPILDVFANELLDSAVLPPDESPSYTAARILRDAPRDEAFDQLRPGLLGLLSDGGQAEAGAAAVVLRPGEAEAAVLARALRDAFGAYPVPPTIVSELAATDEGAKQLDAIWPEWRARIEEPWHDWTIIDPPSREGKVPPPTPTVRARLARALGPALPCLHSTTLQAVRAVAGVALQIELCDLAFDHPALALEYLDLSGHTLFPASAQHALGRASFAHKEIADKLYASWDALRRSGIAAGAFPGVALEPLVLRHDADAIATYCDWLRGGALALPFNPPPLRREVLVHDGVRQVALDVARNMLANATIGVVQPDGQRSRYSPFSTSSGLSALRPAWQNDDHVRAGLDAWLRDPDIEAFRAGLIALEGILEVPARGIVLARLEEEARALIDAGDDEVKAFHYRSCLYHAELQGLTTEMRSTLESLLDVPQVALEAASALIVHLAPDDAAALSARIAAATAHFRAGNIDRASLDRFVSANPEAWRSIRMRRISDPASVEAAVEILDLLPPVQRRRLAEAILTRAGGWELPWVPFGLDSSARPADVARKAAFDVGLRVARPVFDTKQSESG